MKRLIIMTIIKMCGEAVAIAIVVGIIIGIMGKVNQWATSLEYSNALFIAGCLVFIAGASSRRGAGQDWKYAQRLRAESFRGMNASQRANYIIEASSSGRLVILGLLSGGLLILFSLIVPKLF